MKRFFSLLQSKSWTSLFAPAIATVGVGGLIFSGSHIKNIPGKPFYKEQLKNCSIHSRNLTLSYSAKISIVLILLETNLSDMSADISASSQKSEKQVLAQMEEPQVLSHSFLIRQSCAISYEAASKLYTHIYLALEDYSSKYSKGEYDLSERSISEFKHPNKGMLIQKCVDYILVQPVFIDSSSG